MRGHCVCRLLAPFAVFFATALAVGAEEDLVGAEAIVEHLTRGIGIAPIKTPQGHSLPEASPHVSLANIRFALGSAELLPGARRQLNEVAVALQSEALAGFRLLVEGHTCDIGTPAGNQMLSEQRAESARAYLVTRSVAANRLETRGWGQTRPVAPNVSEALRGRNRRVDFVKLESAATPQATRGIPVPGEGLVAGGLIEVTIQGRLRDTGQMPVLTGNADLASGDQFRVRFKVLVGCHVYALFLDSHGGVTWLLPEEDHAYGRWCYAGESRSLPEDDGFYILDDQPGAEVLCVVATPRPVPDADSLPGLLKRHGVGLTAAILAEKAGTANAQVEMLAIRHR